MMSTKTLTYHHQQRTMSIFTLKNSEYRKHFSIAHLNAQSITSTFDEFQVMITENQFDIVSLSETWLCNNKHLLENVQAIILFTKTENRNVMVE